MTDRLTELEAIAQAAAPGQWFVEEDERPGMSWNRHIMSAPNMGVCFMAHSDGKAPERDEATAAHIAAFSPDVALKLLALWRAAQTVVREALDDAEVHPCDVNDDEARARTLFGPVANLRAALEALEKP